MQKSDILLVSYYDQLKIYYDTLVLELEEKESDVINWRQQIEYADKMLKRSKSKVFMIRSLIEKVKEQLPDK